MRKEKEQEELWLQKEVIEFLRCLHQHFLQLNAMKNLDQKQ